MNISTKPGISSAGRFFRAGVAITDRAVDDAMKRELTRQRDEVELI
ncbi:serine hydroxymethyltransferase, partial [Mesorhizobium sp. M2E.F.Ca.ET.154.01.1.1]